MTTIFDHINALTNNGRTLEFKRVGESWLEITLTDRAGYETRRSINWRDAYRQGSLDERLHLELNIMYREHKRGRAIFDRSRK